MAPERFFPDVMRFFYVICLFGLAFAGAPALAQEKPAGWSLCNQTSYVQEVAVGEPSRDTVLVSGWTRLRPGSCRIVLPGPLEGGMYFLHARSSNAHRGGMRLWEGSAQLCVDPGGAFSVEQPETCSALGLVSRGFQPVSIEKTRRWQTVLRETDRYTQAQALAAGLQRLLKDVGVKSGEIDGRMGGRSRRAIAAFLKEQGIAKTPEDPDLIDLLEAEARARASETGLSVCNRTGSKVWSAIARRSKDGWESRGWWGLQPGACAKTIDEPLIRTPLLRLRRTGDPEGSENP